MKKVATKQVSKALTAVAKFTVNSASAFAIHQPKTPKELLKK